MKDQLSRELDATPGFRETYARIFPDDDVSLAVASARARCEMTQQEFARLLGVPLRAVRLLESGNLGK